MPVLAIRLSSCVLISDSENDKANMYSSSIVQKRKRQTTDTILDFLTDHTATTLQATVELISQVRA